MREGRAPAPGMDPEAELRTLRLRFETFRRDFKARLDMTAENLKRIDKEERKAAKCAPRPRFWIFLLSVSLHTGLLRFQGLF